MTMINREDLSPVLQNAYDKAAKGVENDETRTNGKNDETKIDSEQELRIFETEVGNLLANNKIDKQTYDNVKNKIDSIFTRINEVKETKSKKTNKTSSELKREAYEEWRAPLTKYEKEHPIMSNIAKGLNKLTYTLGISNFHTEYNEIRANLPSVYQTVTLSVEPGDPEYQNALDEVFNEELNRVW